VKRTKIEGSSNIAEVGYDMPTLTLQIKFLNGGIYNYWPISRNMFDKLMVASSKGLYFSKHIRGAKGINYLKVDL